jgi:hypothetical protein
MASSRTRLYLGGKWTSVRTIIFDSCLTTIQGLPDFAGVEEVSKVKKHISGSKKALDYF